MISLIGPKGSLLGKRLRTTSSEHYVGVPVWLFGPTILASAGLGWLACWLVKGWR